MTLTVAAFVAIALGLVAVLLGAYACWRWSVVAARNRELVQRNAALTVQVETGVQWLLADLDDDLDLDVADLEERADD